MKVVLIDSENIKKNCKEQLRPSASHGLWLCLLVPLAYLINTSKYRNSLDFEYKFSTIISFGILIQTIFIFLSLSRKNRLPIGVQLINHLIPIFVTSFLIWICLKQEIIFSSFIGCITIIGYRFTYFSILRDFPHSFTLGEATVVTQALILFLLNVFLRFVSYITHHPQTQMEQMTTVLQVSFSGVLIIIGFASTLKFIRGISFYILSIAVVLSVLLFPLKGRTIFTVLALYVFGDLRRICMISMWIGLLGLTAAGMAYHISKETANSTITTRTRKYFHILMVIVFVPGLLYQCTFLYLSSGLLLALFIMLEVARIIELPPMYELLQKAIGTFVDEKDAGLVALTPLYLLAGCSLPLWLHPFPCDLTDSAGFQLLPLLSGIISVGIGDTVASIFGSKYGKHKWHGSNKSIEGTVVSFLCQSLVLPFLIYFGFTKPHLWKIVQFEVAVIVNALIEAKTDQVDNIVLPLVSFNILSI